MVFPDDRSSREGRIVETTPREATILTLADVPPVAEGVRSSLRPEEPPRPEPEPART